MAITSEMNLSIPSLKTPDGSNFQTSINIGANSSNTISETNISGYALSMSIDEQSVDYSYDVTTEDSGEDLIIISSTDSIIVNIILEGPAEGNNYHSLTLRGRWLRRTLVLMGR